LLFDDLPFSERFTPDIASLSELAAQDLASRAGLRYAGDMQVRVVYLGMLRDLAGCEAEIVDIPEGSRLHDLYRDLQQRIPELVSFRKSIALALNQEYSSGITELHPNDEVALIPPVSGGAEGDSTAEYPPQQISAHASLVHQPIEGTAVTKALKRPADGAIAIFDGIVRNQSRGRRTLYLDYSAYEAMALRQMEQLAERAIADFGVRDVRIVHRIGRLNIGESSVYIAVASAHRAAAFDACRWLIDILKRTVPIWKKEHFEDGAVWADGEPFPPEIPVADGSASK
jgi:molybdopterin synthase catalytic subunit